MIGAFGESLRNQVFYGLGDPINDVSSPEITKRSIVVALLTALIFTYTGMLPNIASIIIPLQQQWLLIKIFSTISSQSLVGIGCTPHLDPKHYSLKTLFSTHRCFTPTLRCLQQSY